jgi:hypothetical protein
VWRERPPQQHLVNAAVKNVKHLLDLRNVLMEKMMEEYVAGVNIYLMQVRDASDRDAKRYQVLYSFLCFKHIYLARLRNKFLQLILITLRVRSLEPTSTGVI